jgi:hypothetical protein
MSLTGVQMWEISFNETNATVRQQSEPTRLTGVFDWQ